MALILRQQVETRIPIELQGITPDRLAGLTDAEIAQLQVWHGRNEHSLDQLFQIQGSLENDQTLVLAGDLTAAHWIGAGMQSGKIRVESSCGRHVGSQMRGGEIVIHGNASDFLGVEMTGGSIRVSGNVSDHAGGIYPGSKSGMNRGAIFIEGNAGKGVGQSLRRGTIVVGGNAGELTGWNMKAGTIMVLGECDRHVGAGMTRGTIIIGNGSEENLGPLFARGGVYRVPIIPILANWLKQNSFDFPPELLSSRFHVYSGDQIKGGKGEIFIPAI